MADCEPDAGYRVRGMKIVWVAILAALLAGCAGRTVYICPELPEPARPSVPTLLADGLSCVSDADADRLAERERRIIEYSEDLETIIRTHNRNCRGRDE